MSQTIQIRRGLEADLPADAADGEFLWCRDTGNIFVGHGTGQALTHASANATLLAGIAILAQVPDDGQLLIFDAATGKYVPGDPIVSGPDEPGDDPTRPPVQIGVIDSDGKVARLQLDADGNLPISGIVAAAVTGTVAVSALPAGLATGAKQDTSQATLASIDGKTPALSSGKVPVTDPTALPLPAGASTETTLAAVNTKLGSALPLPTGASTEATLALIKAKTDNLDVLLSTRTKPADTQPISAAALPLPAGASTETTLAAVNTKLGSALPLPTGASTEATLALIKAKTDNLDVLLSTRTKPADTQAVSLASLPAIPAGTNLIGITASPAETSTVYNGTTALTPKFKIISASSSGASEVVALVTGKKIRVLKWDLVASAAVNVKFQSHVTPTDLTGLYYLAANGGLESGFCPVGHFETVAGQALDINLSGAVPVGGVLTYVEV